MDYFWGVLFGVLIGTGFLVYLMDCWIIDPLDVDLKDTKKRKEDEKD